VTKLTISRLLSLSIALLIASGAGGTPLQTSHLASREVQAAGFVSHTLDVRARVFDVAIAPNDRQIAVDAVIASGQREDSPQRKFAEEIQIWEWQSGKLTSRKVLDEQTSVRFSDYAASGRFVRYSDSGSWLIVCRGDGHLLLMDAGTLNVVRDIDMEKTKWPVSTRASNAHSFVRDMEVDAHARHAAVLLSWNLSDGGELRVYDLALGNLIRKWTIPDGTRFSPYGAISLDQEGNRVALSVEPFIPGERTLRPDENNVVIYEVSSGRLVNSLNTGYLAGSVCLGANGTVLTVSGDNAHPDRNGKDTLKIWDVQTGKLLREIASPPEGIHYNLQISEDGRVAVAYDGLEKTKGFLERVNITVSQRLRMWDLTTGKVLATTPDLLPTVQGGSPHFRVSPKGDLIVIYAIGLSRPLSIFEIMQSQKP
jgi:WD40 repeat protein